MKTKKKTKTRIMTDLGNPALIHLLKAETQLNNTSMREILLKALESYFAHSLETKALTKSSDAIFNEWNNEFDSEYDHL